MKHECCYHNCPREGVVHIGVNGNPDTHWICFHHLSKWNTDRSRFLADGGGCQMQELGELLREKSTSRMAGTGILTLAFIQRRSKTARSNIAEGTRLFALAGRPTKAQFVKVYGLNGPKMAWVQRAKAGVDAKHFQAALKAKS
jgi:hypothetical protein